MADDHPDQNPIEKRPDDAVPPMPPVDAKSLIATQSAPSGNQPDNQYRSGGSWGPIPAMTDGMTFREVGSSGLRAFSGWVREEFLPQLVGRQGAQKYREMMDNSPDIGGIMFAIISTMRKVEWRVEPADDSGAAAEQADFVSSCMDDMSHTWTDFVAEALSMLGYGFAPHEIVYKRRLGQEPGVPDPDNPLEPAPTSKYDDGKIGWRRLPIRGQDTVLKWFFGQNGGIKGVTQQPWIGPIIDLPIEKLLLFRPSAHKNNPEGRSVLRTSYVPYYYVKRLQEQEAILAERLGGVPEITVPLELITAAEAGDAQAAATLQVYKRMATNLRLDEQMGVIMPSNVYVGANGQPSAVRQYGFQLVAPGGARGGGVDFEKTITRYKVAMMTSTLADFLQLGHESRGTQALAVSKVDMFFQGIEGFLNSMADVVNRFAIPRLWKLNALNYDLMPKIVPDLAQRVDLDVLSNFILRLSQAGMPMFPNEDLQSYILDAAGLPDIEDDRALQAAGMTDEQLDRDDEKADVMLDRLKEPPAPAPGPPGPGGKPGASDKPGPGGGAAGTPRANLEKMVAAAVARRMIRAAGPSRNIVTPTRKGVHRHGRRLVVR